MLSSFTIKDHPGCVKLPLVLQIDRQRKPGPEVQCRLGATTVLVLAIPDLRQARVQSKIGIILCYFEPWDFLSKTHTTKKESHCQ
jgi:hypothetical protein